MDKSWKTSLIEWLMIGAFAIGTSVVALRCAENYKNIRGLEKIPGVSEYCNAREALDESSKKKLSEMSKQEHVELIAYIHAYNSLRDIRNIALAQEDIEACRKSGKGYLAATAVLGTLTLLGAAYKTFFRNPA